MIYTNKQYKVNIVYNIIGNGNWLVVLHGWGSNRNVFANIAVNLNYKCLLIDIPPFGESSELNQDWTIPMYADLINQMLLELQIHNPTIMAHSFGGRIALELAYKYQNIRKLILTGSAGVSRKSLKVKSKILLNKVKKTLLKNVKNNKHNGSPDYLALPPVMKKTFQNIVNHDQTSQLKYINCPTLIIWGQNDTETPLQDAKTLSQKIKNSQLIIFKSCGHFCFLEQTALFSQIVYNYINEGDY